LEQYEELYSNAECFLSKGNLNLFKVHEWRTLLGESDFQIEKYDELILYFSVSAFQANTSFSSVDPPKFFDCLQKEIYSALTDDANRGKANILLTSAIAGLSAMVATQFQINPFIVGGILDLISISIAKVGVDAWCRYYEGKRLAEKEPEAEAIPMKN